MSTIVISHHRGPGSEIAFDDNLGMPDDLAARADCRLSTFHELDAMLTAFAKAEVDAMFCPAGLLPYLDERPDAPYSVIAQATVGPQRTARLKSVLVACKQSRIETGIDALGSRLSRVNRYCTTSYWAPMVTFLDKTPAGTPVTFADAKGFVDMLDSVAAGRNDAAMVWDVILERNPELANEVIALPDTAVLPAPLIVARADTVPSMLHDLEQTLADFQSSDAGALFNGFTKPDQAILAGFRRGMKASLSHYAFA
jgi:hypothetical protein